MKPEPHVCCKCKKEVVWTDCLPAICYRCHAEERTPKGYGITKVIYVEACGCERKGKDDG